MVIFLSLEATDHSVQNEDSLLKGKNLTVPFIFVAIIWFEWFIQYYYNQSTHNKVIETRNVDSLVILF